MVEGKTVDLENVVSIDSSTINKKLLDKMKTELSTPNREYSNGKIRVEPKEKIAKRLGLPSHNLADALVMAFDPQKQGGFNWDNW